MFRTGTGFARGEAVRGSSSRRFAPVVGMTHRRCSRRQNDRAADGRKRKRADLEKIYRAAVAAVDPALLVGIAMDGRCSGAEQVPDLIAGASRILLLAVGKAAGANGA